MPHGLARLVAGAGRLARGAVGLVARGVGGGDRLRRLLRLGERGLLGPRGALGGADSSSRRLRSDSSRSSPPAGHLAQLAGGRATTPGPARVTATPWKSGRTPSKPSTTHTSASRPRASDGRGAGVLEDDVREQRLGVRAPAAESRRREKPAGRRGVAGGHQRGAAVAARALEQRGGLGERAGHRRAQPRPERGGQRELVARLGPQRVGQRRRAARRARVRAQELVDRGELGADLGGLAAGLARRRRRPRGARGGRRRRPRRPRGGAPAPRRRPRRAARTACGGRRAALLELGDSLGQALLAALGELLELGLQRRDALLAAVVVALVLAHLGLEPGQQRAAALRAVLDQRDRRAGALEPQPDPLRRRPRRVGAVGQRLALVAAGGQRRLGLLARRAQLRQLGLDRLVLRLRAHRLGLGGRQLLAGHPRVLARQRPARLVGLAREPLVQLRGLGLALERPQPRPRLALDVQRAVEVVLRALQLELRAAPALAVLAEPGGLLDQQPPVPRLRGHDLLDPALRDDRVHLLAQPGVAEDLEHVDQAALRPVDAVLALPRAVEPARDRDLARGQVDRAVAVVQHDLDLGLACAPARRARRRRSRPASTARARPAATARPAPTARRR